MQRKEVIMDSYILREVAMVTWELLPVPELLFVFLFSFKEIN